MIHQDNRRRIVAASSADASPSCWTCALRSAESGSILSPLSSRSWARTIISTHNCAKRFFNSCSGVFLFNIEPSLPKAPRQGQRERGGDGEDHREADRFRHDRGHFLSAKKT